MGRQRVRIHGSAVAGYVGRALVVVFALALVWYGAMLVLLAVKVAPGTVNGLCGYRDAYDYLAKLTPNDITAKRRLIVGLTGVLAAGIFGYLAWRDVPRTHLTRTAVTLDRVPRGTTAVAPRTFERAAEVAALAHPVVTGARARYDDQAIMLDIHAGQAGAVAVAETLREVRQRALSSLAEHELRVDRVNVTLAGVDRPNRRELA